MMTRSVARCSAWSRRRRRADLNRRVSQVSDSEEEKSSESEDGKPKTPGPKKKRIKKTMGLRSFFFFFITLKPRVE